MTEGPASAPLAHIEPGAVPFDAPVSGTIAAIFPGLQEEVLAHGDREASSERSSEQEEELSLRSLLARVKKVERNQLYGLREDIQWLSNTVRALKNKMHTVGGTAAICADRLNALAAGTAGGGHTPPQAKLNPTT